MLCNYLKCGKIYKVSENYSRYQVENIQDLFHIPSPPSPPGGVGRKYGIKEKIIPHFDKYPLQSKKAHDYKVFKEIINNLDTEMRKPKKTLQEKKIFIRNCVFHIPSPPSLQGEWM
jgi:hypothetical protein